MEGPHWQVIPVRSRPPGEQRWIDAVHVTPSYGPAHELSGDTCWCGPETETYANGNWLVVHRDCN